MDEAEKNRRCDDAEVWYHPDRVGVTCRVYGRTVIDCFDCAFNVHGGPHGSHILSLGDNMLKNTDGKEPDTFEQAMEYRITNIDNRDPYSENEYSDGMRRGYRYALAIYRECRKDGTI